MKIASANVQMQSSHLAYQRTQVSAHIESWQGDRRPAGGGRIGPGAAIAKAAQSQVRLSREAVAAREAETIGAESDAVDADPRMKFLKAVIEYFTGRPVRTLGADELARMAEPRVSAAELPRNANEGSARAGFGLELDVRASYVEFERTRFEAQGVAQTADGQTIRFELEFSMERLYAESADLQFRVGDARLRDPLVLDFAGPAAALSNTRFAFDLDSDGQVKQIPMLAGGRGFLAFDRDSNGRIDDGRELFGPASGDGFAELGALDADGNGWIDEADPAFEQLRIWRPAEHGHGSLGSLARAGVGALYLGRVETPFDLRGTNNETLGMMRTSSIYLRADGGAGTVSQIDLSV